MVNVIFVILVALVLAYFFSEMLRYFRMPRVIGQILAGIVLGFPFFKKLLFTSDVLLVFSFLTNIGIILLFFFVGLEINTNLFKKNFKESSLISIFNTIIPLIAGYLAAKFLFKFEDLPSVVIGISLSVSSQAISLDILEELKLIKSRIGNIIIASGAIDDVFELLLISSILVAFHSAALGQTNIQKLLIDIIAFILVIILFRISLIPLALRIFEREKSQASLFMGSLIIVLMMAYISELFGIGSLIGALVAGILVRQTLLTGEDRKPWRMNEISHSIHVISFGFLIPIFFVSVGLNTDINIISSNLLLVFVLIAIDIFGTLFGTILGVKLSGGTFKEGNIVGWGIIPKGDTELVIATLALNSGLISLTVYTAIITVALLTTLVSPIVFRFLIKRNAEIVA